jgi:hypothetical protein
MEAGRTLSTGWRPLSGPAAVTGPRSGRRTGLAAPQILATADKVEQRLRELAESTVEIPVRSNCEGG